MTRTTVSIEADIRSRRQALRNNFDEIEEKFNVMTDFHKLFDRHAGKMLAGAMSAGALVAALSGGREQTQVRHSPPNLRRAPDELRSSRDHAGGLMPKVIPLIKNVMIGIAMTWAEGFFDALFGLSRMERRTGPAAGGASRSAQPQSK